jgi:hypothetical protein
MPTAPDSSRRLDSWKEIAAYLDRDVRTVMRWAKSDGLPVHRIAGRARGAVYAHAAEIDEWMKGGRRAPPPEAPLVSPAPVAPSRRPWAIVAGICTLVLVATAAATFMSPAPPISRAALLGRDLVAFDATGKDLWRRG